ncbi:hypothetical protein [Streptomyces sp. NPDC048606]|uniref:hypothetical protein n=1 Tax=Streptomyces sp. NPDC048606 TaxID=3154726 RepID=UPI003418BF58
MADEVTGVTDALVEAAGEGLRAGATPVAVFAELAARSTDWPAAARAVCLALGVSAEEVDRRLGPRSRHAFLRDFEAGEEEACGELLELVGAFDVPRPLDERGQEIRRLLSAAVRASGGLGGGHALSLSRRFMKAEPAEAFLSLAHSGPRGAGCRGTVEFWEAMNTAGTLLASDEAGDDDRIARAVEACHDHLTRARA